MFPDQPCEQPRTFPEDHLPEEPHGISFGARSLLSGPPHQPEFPVREAGLQGKSNPPKVAGFGAHLPSRRISSRRGGY